MVFVATFLNYAHLSGAQLSDAHGNGERRRVPPSTSIPNVRLESRRRWPSAVKIPVLRLVKMEYAFDSVLKRDVQADSPEVRRGQPGRYIWCMCRSGAYLAQGDSIGPHFRHNHGQVDPDCELYTPPLKTELLGSPS